MIRLAKLLTMFRLQEIVVPVLPLVVLVGCTGVVRGAEPYEAFLQKHCVRCHGPEKKKGELRLDQLSRDFRAGADTQRWAEVVEKINSGEMPPKQEPKPAQDEIAAFV